VRSRTCRSRRWAAPPASDPFGFEFVCGAYRLSQHGRAALPALLDLILVQLLRRWHEQHDAAWPTADDPAVTLALREIHQNPQRQWTVQRLSTTVGLPRTAFTRRFIRATGQPPIRYLISWRLSRGAQLLRQTDAPLAAIADQVGYSTEFSFSGAFRREYGMSPGRFRRTPAAASVHDDVPSEAGELSLRPTRSAGAGRVRRHVPGPGEGGRRGVPGMPQSLVAGSRPPPASARRPSARRPEGAGDRAHPPRTSSRARASPDPVRGSSVVAAPSVAVREKADGAHRPS